jgi:capsular polysaccharide biosynthesis protein
MTLNQVPNPRGAAATLDLLLTAVEQLRAATVVLSGDAAEEAVLDRVTSLGRLVRVVRVEEFTSQASLGRPDLLYLDDATDPELLPTIDRFWPTLADHAVVIAHAPPGTEGDRALRAFAALSGTALLIRADGAAALTESARRQAWLLEAGLLLTTPPRPPRLDRESRLFRLPAKGSTDLVHVTGDAEAAVQLAAAKFAEADTPEALMVHVFQDAIVTGDMAIFTPRGGVLESQRFKLLADLTARHERLDRTQLETLELGFFVGASWTPNYFHWFTESLLSIDLYRRARSVDPPTLVGPPLKSYERECLSLLGLDALPVRGVPLHDGVRVKRLTALSPAFGRNYLRPPPHLLDMCERMLAAATVDRPLRSPGRWLYISRSDSTKRRLLEEPELASRLAQRGFEVLTMGDLRVAEQARTFAEAEVIVAPHGAGLSNLGFCRPGARVLELTPDHYLNPCFARISALAGLQHLVYVGTASPSGDSRRHWRTWSVDQDRVLAEVDRLIAA